MITPTPDTASDEQTTATRSPPVSIDLWVRSLKELDLSDPNDKAFNLVCCIVCVCVCLYLGEHEGEDGVEGVAD